MHALRLPLVLIVLIAAPGCDEMPRATCGSDGDVRTIDINADGRPDVRTVTLGDRVCRETDLDFDGRPDAIEVSDREGRKQWVGHDLDLDGRVDKLERHAGGALVEELLDLDHDGQPDQRRRFRDGKPLD